ncbi:hypothetical protein HAZT_HAZT002190 [Hyalella azteca]|uniref:BAAT/Acyl-CoA thioester hydrolase C-terminal domain-containing protein n=1 Tax=Hyalella azteca TaxID=294128 RepID=A0A6A0H3C8_HYAAZ|nr:hypothetical protein HAZT_HAZT002190 [Hyalella azteca]
MSDGRVRNGQSDGSQEGLRIHAPHNGLGQQRCAFLYGRDVQFVLSLYQCPIAVQLATIGAEKSGLKPVCSVQHERLLMAEGCQRIPVRDGKVRGTLFLPPGEFSAAGEGPFPGVVDMFGGAGGLMEHRAALFAARGFATLALAYFAYEDLQESMQTGFDIAYFDEAVQYLLSRQEVRKVGVGVIESSKGDIALSMATYIPQIKAAVVVNGGIYSAVGAFKLLDGTHRAVVPLAFEKLVLHRDGVMETYHAMSDPPDHPEAIIPVEDAYGDILWLSGLADRAMNTEMFARLAVERCTERGKPDKVKVRLLVAI